MTQDWFALQVKYRHEKHVALALRGKGFEEYLPLYRPQHRSGQRMESVELPLFPTYVFCRFDPQRRLPILQIPGVFGVVSVGRTPAPVEPEELAAVRAVVTSGLPLEPCPYLKVGDVVVIDEGPLAGTTGILQRYTNRDRLVISVRLFQSSVAVEIDRFAVSRSTIRSASSMTTVPLHR